MLCRLRQRDSWSGEEEQNARRGVVRMLCRLRQRVVVVVKSVLQKNRNLLQRGFGLDSA